MTDQTTPLPTDPDPWFGPGLTEAQYDEQKAAEYGIAARFVRYFESRAALELAADRGELVDLPGRATDLLSAFDDITAYLDEHPGVVADQTGYEFDGDKAHFLSMGWSPDGSGYCHKACAHCGCGDWHNGGPCAERKLLDWAHSVAFPAPPKKTLTGTATVHGQSYTVTFTPIQDPA